MWRATGRSGCGCCPPCADGGAALPGRDGRQTAAGAAGAGADCGGLCGGPCALSLTVANPLLQGPWEGGAKVLGPMVLDTLLLAYGLPGLALLALGLRFRRWRGVGCCGWARWSSGLCWC